jgi:hypothetical protein
METLKGNARQKTDRSIKAIPKAKNLCAVINDKKINIQ